MSKKEFSPTIGFWTTKKGNGYSSIVKNETLKLFETAKEGDTLYLEEVESDNSKAPKLRVSLISKSQETSQDEI